MITDDLLIQIAGSLAALYGIGAFITYASKMPNALKLTVAAQTLLLGTILITYLNNLSANIVFILAIITTITNVVVFGYEVNRVPSSRQKMLKLIDQVLPK